MQINKAAVLITVLVVVIALGGLYLIYRLTGSAPSATPPTNGQNLTASTTASTTTSTSNNMTDTSSKLDIQIIKAGTGPAAKDGDTLTVNYTGTLTNGTKFDSSLDTGRTPYSFTLGDNHVIAGWDQGLVGAKAGEELKLTVPPALGYGSSPNGSIPANSTLIFDITVLKIN
ncbi:FKBP-type peptidyl-prolyl cis-trans isomerase [Patescibacteria group bacterium]|nr:FKBP-type peptidyl-prolyl cis-trans isomerase [Patescibacteria group bacterium]